MKKSKVSLKSALVLSLFTANVIHSSGIVPVISQGITAYAEVYYSYNPDDECGVNGDSKQKNGKGDDLIAYRQALLKIRFGRSKGQQLIKMLLIQ